MLTTGFLNDNATYLLVCLLAEMEEVLRSSTSVVIPQCKNALLQVKVLHSDVYLRNVLFK